MNYRFSDGTVEFIAIWSWYV